MPFILRMDNGPEVISHRRAGLCEAKVQMCFIPPGTPWNNGFVESFNCHRRYECLQQHAFDTTVQARALISSFHEEHNQEHRHSSLGYLTPREFAAKAAV